MSPDPRIMALRWTGADRVSVRAQHGPAGVAALDAVTRAASPGHHLHGKGTGHDDPRVVEDAGHGKRHDGRKPGNEPPRVLPPAQCAESVGMHGCVLLPERQGMPPDDRRLCRRARARCAALNRGLPVRDTAVERSSPAKEHVGHGNEDIHLRERVGGATVRLALRPHVCARSLRICQLFRHHPLP